MKDIMLKQIDIKSNLAQEFSQISFYLHSQNTRSNWMHFTDTKASGIKSCQKLKRISFAR